MSTRHEISRPVLLLGAADDDSGNEPTMRFRLVLESNSLRPSQPINPNAPASPKQETLTAHKHELRRQIHRQLERLWAVNKTLREAVAWEADFQKSLPVTEMQTNIVIRDDKKIPLKDILAKLHKKNDYRFVPLVRRDWDLSCSISILFLRRQKPGRVFYAGDLDNRIKTIIDALAMPQHINQFPADGPRKDEKKYFFVLAEDDALISRLEVEGDELLDPLIEGEDENFGKVRAIITVDIRPHHLTNRNQMFS
jgi:hypothetical protein